MTESRKEKDKERSKKRVSVKDLRKSMVLKGGEAEEAGKEEDKEKKEKKEKHKEKDKDKDKDHKKKYAV